MTLFVIGCLPKTVKFRSKMPGRSIGQIDLRPRQVIVNAQLTDFGKTLDERTFDWHGGCNIR